MPKFAKVIFPRSFDDGAAYEMIYKGYVATLVEIESEYYSVWFFDLARARQELERSAEIGHPYFTEEGVLVLIPKVTVEGVVTAVCTLLSDKHNAYSSYWKPLQPDEAFDVEHLGKYDHQVEFERE